MFKSESSPAGLMRLFAMLDKNNDSIITNKELRDGLHCFGFTADQIQKFSNDVDLNSDGQITLDEYKKVFNIPSKTEDVTRGVDECIMLKLFAELDKNGDKKISRAELADGVKGIGLPPRINEEFLSTLDLDKDGFITLDEYRTGLGLTCDPITDWKKLFDALDKDKSGEISVLELKEVFNRHNIPILRSGLMEWIAAHDKNKNGSLDYAEFLSFVSNQTKKTG